MALVSLGAWSQVVRGVVTDGLGEPLPGVSVVLQGSTLGSITNIDGEYSIGAKPGDKLVFSYIGFVEQVATVSGGVLNITLREDSKALDELVVIGYGAISRKDVASSITTVKAKDLNVGSYTDPGQLLQGKVPGLTVVQSSDPNSGVNSLTLRGASTLNGSTSPLYVVDGIPGVNINLISPSDIESIDVLRDASATAIYGSKAANGVIMVTTKKGNDGPARVQYSGYVSFENIANDLDMMSASELREYAAANDITITNDYGADTDWVDLCTQTGFAQNHNVSISGGNKSTSYSVSANYMQRDGVIKSTGNNMFTMRSYIETKTLKDHLTLAAGINGNIRNQWGVATDTEGKSVYNAMYYYSPLVPVYDEDGNYWDESSNKRYNPLAMISEDRNHKTYKRMQYIGKASLKIIDGLVYNASINYETLNYDYKDYYSTQSQTNTRNGETSRSVTQDYKKNFETYLNYDATFNTDHKLGLMAGYSWEQQDTGEGFGASTYNFYDDSVGWNNIGLGNSSDTDAIYANTLSSVRMISFYGRVNYSYASKYILQATVRRDGSSAFGTNNRWATFPSASLAWRVTEEKFMKGQSVFDDLKLRAAWGMSGNSAGFDAYTSRFYYTTGSRFDYTDENGNTVSYKGLTAARNVNEDLKWETTTMLNLGIDATFLGGRLGVTLEYYNKTTKDMIWDYSVSTTKYPVNWLTANVGTMNNKGVELSINYRAIQTKDFTWDTSLNLSHNKNKIVSISNDDFNAGVINEYNPNMPEYSTATIQRIIEGQPIGTFYMWEWAGYNEDGVSTFYVHDPETGERTGETTTTPTDDDRTIVGNAQPKLQLGFNNTFSYKNWDANIFFTGVFGQKIYNELKNYLTYVNLVSDGRNVLACIKDYSATDTKSSTPSDRFLENGSYLKLATLTVGYTFKNCFNDWLRDVRVYVSGNNLYTFTSYSGRDPEICLDGLTPGIDSRHDHYPRTRQFLVGATINF